MQNLRSQTFVDNEDCRRDNILKKQNKINYKKVKIVFDITKYSFLSDIRTFYIFYDVYPFFEIEWYLLYPVIYIACNFKGFFC